MTAFDSSGSTAVTTGQTSATLDITAASVGAWCYAWVAVGSSNAGAASIAATGWTTLVGSADGTIAEYAVLRRQKQLGDTTFTVTWTTSAHAELVWASWSGLGATPDEGAAIAVNGTTSRTAVPTPTATPTSTDRWAVGFFSNRTSTSANKNITWTPDAAQTERVDANNSAGASSVWFGNEIADTNAAVTQAAHSYTATHAPAAESHDGSAILFLIPAAVAATTPPQIVSRRVAPVSVWQTSRRRQNADFVPITLSLPWDPPRYTQRSPIAARSTPRARQNADTAWPVPVQPTYALNVGERRWSKPPWPRRGNTITGRLVPVQPPERMQFVRRGSRPLWPRRGNVVPTGWPVPVQPPETSIQMRPRFTRVLLFRRGNVPSTGWPVPVQPPELPTSQRPKYPRRRFLRPGVVPESQLPPIVPTSQWLRARFKPPWPRRGVVPPTGLPVPVQPPERMQSVRRGSRPLWHRRGITHNVTPPQVTVNPPISWSIHRWSRPLWPRRGIVAPTGLPVPVQPPERMQSVRRWTRPLLPRKGVTENIAPPPPVTIIPFVPVTQRHQFRRIFRVGRTVQAPGILPGPIPSASRPGRYRKIMRPRMAEPGTPFLPQVQPPNTPDAQRRKRRFIPPRRGDAQPNTGLPVPVQPPKRMQFVRRWIKPLFPRKGVVPPSAPLPVVIVEVKLPVWVWLTNTIPNSKVATLLPPTYIVVGIPKSTIAVTLPTVSIVVTIPLANEKEV